ncbi:unnamed protein product [Mycena citricolor]|uniref:Uncharacterized protein n=1 Tax=Mycena citricolor TaxID=2018698 RepID=A0AAD2Q7I8_9AGAR|nr:unnamed protein product [Mycena citricolor]
MATPTPMPARGDRNAPVFDSSKPHELRRYFLDLEFLLARSAVTDAAQMKGHAVRFLSVEDQEIWEGLPSFSDANKSYHDFKLDALSLYAGNDTDRRFSLDDLDMLVGQTSRMGIHTKDDLTQFYRRFLHITTFLISKQRLSVAEQSRFFLRAMNPASLSVSVRQRLQIKKPDVHPEDPYDLSDLYDAAKFVLSGSSTLLPGMPTSQPGTKLTIKSDPGITALVSSVSDLVRIIAAQHANPGAPAQSQSANALPRRRRPDGCSYCSDLEHFISQCPHVSTDIRDGKCRRNVDGKVVLPSGAYVPNIVQGKDLRERIQKWHEANPGQAAAPQMILEVSHQNLLSSAAPGLVQTFKLTDEERMAVLTAEINQLRTRAQAKRAMEVANQPEVPERTIPPAVARNPVVPPVPIETVPPATAPAAPVAPPQPPIHPYAAARDGAYAPPKERNVGIPAQKSQPPRSSAPIYNPKDAAAVFDAILDIPVTQTLRQTLSIAPEVRAQFREATSFRRPPAKTGEAVPQFLHPVTDSTPYDLPYAQDDSDLVEKVLQQQRNEDARLALAAEHFPVAYSQTFPPDAWVVPDKFAGGIADRTGMGTGSSVGAL